MSSLKAILIFLILRLHINIYLEMNSGDSIAILELSGDRLTMVQPSCDDAIMRYKYCFSSCQLEQHSISVYMLKKALTIGEPRKSKRRRKEVEKKTKLFNSTSFGVIEFCRGDKRLK